MHHERRVDIVRQGELDLHGQQHKPFTLPFARGVVTPEPPDPTTGEQSFHTLPRAYAALSRLLIAECVHIDTRVDHDVMMK